MRGDFTRSTFDPGKRYSGVRLQQGRVQLDADWNEQVDIDAHLRETGVGDLVGRSGAPRTGGGFRITPTGDGRDLGISAGRFYVDGILCELRELAVPATYKQQPDLPEPPAVEAGVHFVYLDVWRHHVTALEDDAIRERALGGPDTATRTQTVFQVKLLKVGETADAGIHCLSDPEPWQRLVAPTKARMRARIQPQVIPTDPCVVPATAGYTGLENQLYRVEIHAVEEGGTTFKWSRENGSVVAGWTAQNGRELTVESLGRDRVLRLVEAEGEGWVELTDDLRELQGEPGVMVRAEIPEAAGNVLTIDQDIDRADFPLHPRIRRWEDEPRTVETPAENDGWLALENGIEIRFEGDGFRPGDHWLIPARAFVGEHAGDIEWPREGATWAARPPDGIVHHYAKLAVVVFDQTFRDALDCRLQFPALTELIHLSLAGGDGQEAPPGKVLPCALAVGVTNGRWPVEGARVLFEVADGQGALFTENARVTEAIVLTAADGIATCQWELPERFPGDETTCLQVTARLVDVDGRAVGTPVFFHARFLLAAETQEERIRLRAILFQNDDARVENDLPVEPERLAKGLRIICSDPLAPEPFERIESLLPDATPSRPVCFVTIDLPFPLEGDGQSFWQQSLFGFRPVVLAARLELRETEILWTPTDATARWLGTVLPRLRNMQIADRLLVHLTLKGNFIWHRDRPDVFLDGNAFGRAEDRHVGLDFRGGDRVRGGDFEMWFWLAPQEIRPIRFEAVEGDEVLRTIGGLVLDAATGDPVVADVNLIGTASRTTTTSENGRFLFANLPSTRRTYELEARANGGVANATVTLPARPIPSREIPGVGEAFAGRLTAANVTTADQIAGMEPAQLAQILGISPNRAETIIQAARQLVGQ